MRVLLFAFCCAALTADLYYLQPLTALLASSFAVQLTWAGYLVTSIQFGYVIGVVFIVPLSDVVNHRRLVAVMLACNVISLRGQPDPGDPRRHQRPGSCRGNRHAVVWRGLYGRRNRRGRQLYDRPFWRQAGAGHAEGRCGRPAMSRSTSAMHFRIRSVARQSCVQPIPRPENRILTLCNCERHWAIYHLVRQP
jgi:hypothetical protein